MKRHILYSAIIFALLALICPSSRAVQAASIQAAPAAPGTLDPTFAGFSDDGIITDGSIGTDFNNFDMALQPDGKIVVVGGKDSSNQLSVFRYLPNGRLDRTFDGDGKALYPGMFPADAVALQSDGRIVIGGSRDGDFQLARLTPSGALDISFDGDGWTQDFDPELRYLINLIAQPDGKIVACGSADVDDETDFGITRYNINGSRDTSFGGDGKVTIPFGGYDYCHDIARQGDGKVIVVGSNGGLFLDDDFALARLNVDGTLDKSFDGDGKLTTGFGEDESASAVVLQPDGKFVVLGNDRVPDTTFVARYKPNGALDTTFAGDGKLTISVDWLGALALQPDGKIIMLGSHESPDGDSKFALHRIDTNGAPDPSFGDGGIHWLDFGGNDLGKSLALLPDGRILAGGVSGDAITLARLWPDGTTFDTSGQQVHGLAFPNVNQPGFRESANALAALPDGSTVVAGQVYNRTSSSSDAFLMRFTPDGLPDLAFATNGSIRLPAGNFNAARAIALQTDGKILIAGYTAFSADQSVMDFMIARFNSNGTPDITFGAGGSQLVDFAGRADGATAIAIAPDDKIVVAGNAWNGSRQVWGVARLTITGQLDTSFDGDGRAYIDFVGANAANAVVVQPDNKVVVAGTNNGDFFLQRLLPNGARDSSFGINGGGYNATDLGGTDTINALALAPNGWIYAAGTRTQTLFSDIALAQYTPNGLLASCAPGAPCANWPTGTVIVDAGASDYAYALDLRDDNQLVAAGCSNSHFVAVQLRTDGEPNPQPFNTDFVGQDCARAVQFSGKDKIVMAGTQRLAPFVDDDNVALARFTTTVEGPVSLPAAPNLLANPDFELDADNDTRPDSWVITPASANVTRDAAMKVNGAYSMRHASTTLPTYTVSQVVPNIRLSATYAFAGSVNVPATSDAFSFHLVVRWRSSTNAVIASSPIKSFTQATNGWVKVAALLQAPPGAKSATLEMVATSLQATVYVDSLSFAVDNLLLNGTFEADADNNTRPDGWTSNANVTRSNSVRHSGGFAMRHTSTTNADYSVVQKVPAAGTVQQYVFSGWVNIPTTSDAFSFELRVTWRNASGTDLSSQVVKRYDDDTAGQWSNAAAVLATPTGAVYAVVEMRVSDLNATVFVDDVVLRP